MIQPTGAAPARFIQISATAYYLYALDSNGCVYWLDRTYVEYVNDVPLQPRPVWVKMTEERA